MGLITANLNAKIETKLKKLLDNFIDKPLKGGKIYTLFEPSLGRNVLLLDLIFGEGDEQRTMILSLDPEVTSRNFIIPQNDT